MIDDQPIQSFDLPAECEIDHVAIYPNNDPEGPHFYAVPFILEEENEDGPDWYNEPDDFEVTDEYKNAVAERTDVDIGDIKLTRELEVFGFDSVGEIDENEEII
jgi:hypothetical protein